MQKFENFCKGFILYLNIIILFILTVLNIIYTTDVGNGEIAKITRVPFISIILILLLSFLYIVICEKARHIKINKKIIIPIIFIIYIIINILWINWSNIIPTDDSKSVHEIAIAIVNHNMEILQSNTYLEKCPQQIGMAVIFSLIYKMFHSTNYQVIQYLNVLANILTIIGLYKITKRIDTKNYFNVLIYLSLILTLIPLILLTTYVYSDYLGLTLTIWATYFAIKYHDTNKTKHIIISALLMCLSCIIKTNYLVSFIAIIIYLILNIINNHKSTIKKVCLVLLYSIFVLAPYMALKNIVATSLNLTNSEAIPMSGYLYMGMSESDRGAGWYGVAVLPAWEDATASRELYPQLIKERLKEFINNPIYCIRFYARKVASGWEDPYFQSIWYNVMQMNRSINFDEILSNNLYIFIKLWLKVLLLLIYGFAFIYTLLNRKNINLDTLLLIVIFLGGFFFHILWEIKSRYVLPYVIMIIPLATLGIGQFIEHVNLNKLSQKQIHND